MTREEILVSVDIEASGPSPSTGSLIALGACLVDEPAVGIYLELQPIPGHPWSHEAEAVHGLTPEHLAKQGLEPGLAMRRLNGWLADVAAARQPVFVGFNAPFDWMFVADYCHRFLGANPFGISALDIKAYYMGRQRIERWADTARLLVADRYGLDKTHSHHALDDAREQAQLMRVLRERR